MSKKVLIISLSVMATAVLTAAVYLYSLKVRIENGDLVKFNNQWYTKDELRKIVPPQTYEVASKNTPEEVYSQFRDALLKGDTETALSLVRLEKREEYKELFAKSLESYKKLPEVGKIRKAKSDSVGNYSSYYYDSNDADKMPYSIEFIKNDKGYWEIDSI